MNHGVRTGVKSKCVLVLVGELWNDVNDEFKLSTSLLALKKPIRNKIIHDYVN